MNYRLTHKAWWNRKRTAFVSFTSLLVFCVFSLPLLFVTPHVSKRMSTRGNANQLALPVVAKVMVWNIAKGCQDDFCQDFEALSIDADLLLIQECCDCAPASESLANRDNIHYSLAHSFEVRTSGMKTGVATGSIATPVESKVFISDNVEPIIKTPKSALVSKYQLTQSIAKSEFESTTHAAAVSKEILLVVNIHGLNIVRLASLRQQLQSIEPAVQSHVGPVLFAGDFNTNSKKKHEFLFQYMEDLGLTEIRFEAGDQRMTAPFGTLPLDHAFARGLTITNARVMGELDGSDHKALMFEISAVNQILDPTQNP